MTQAPATPQPSIPSSAVASPAGYPQAQSQTAPASYPTATAVAAPSPAYQQQVAPQVNPWQEAFNRLSDSLSATPSYQPQVPSWPMTQQVAPSPVAYPSAPVSYQAAQSISAPQTSPYQQTQAYSPATLPQAAPYSGAQSAPSSDEYLQNVSSESLEVLQHFGAEAPALLNRYACVVEDALLNQAQQTAQAMEHLQQLEEKLQGSHAVITAAAEDNAAYHTLLTDPDLLADYVNEFYGPSGPYPTETSRDRLEAEVAAADPFYRGEQQAPQYQRPQMEMPSPNVQAASGGDDFWATFSAMSDRNPAAAWQILSQATPDALRSKVLVSEG